MEQFACLVEPTRVLIKECS